MRNLKRNERVFWYAQYTGREAVTDAGGYLTGEYTHAYGDPIAIRGNVSPAHGGAQVYMFGKNLVYDNEIVIHDPACPITEDSVLWLDADPDSGADYDHIVYGVARSLNHTRYQVSKVNVREQTD